MPCPAATEFFGTDLRPGVYALAFPPRSSRNLQDAEPPVLDGGRVWLDDQEWKVTTDENVDVFAERLEHAGMPCFDPLVEDLWPGTVRGISPRTA